MAVTEVIINGDFSNSTNTSAVGWSGTDIETRNSNVYLPGSNQGRTIEMNGGTGQVSVVEQTFTLTDDHDGSLSFDYALRGGNNPATAGVDGFRVEILDSSGGVLYTQDILPTATAYLTLTVPISFPSAGDYTIRFTELGDNADGLGALLDNVSVLVCYGGETRISTPQGEVCAKDLRVGQYVDTLNGPCVIRWVGRRSVTPNDMETDARFRPVRITKDALRSGLPKRDLLVSRQHRIMVSSPVAQRMLGESDVLVPAIRFTGLPGVFIDTEIEEIEYIHVLLDHHEVMLAEGTPAESLLLGAETITAVGAEAMEEIDLIFPDLQSDLALTTPARMVPHAAKQKNLMRRIAKNKRPVLERYQAA